MVYEPHGVRKFLTRGKCFAVVSWKAVALKKVVIRLALIHRKSSACDCSACFDDVISAVKSVQDLIDFFKLSFLTADSGNYNRRLDVYKHRLWRLTDRAYRSSLRHGYNTQTFLNGFFSQ